MRHLVHNASPLLFGLALLCTGPAVAQGLPGGATTLTESHGDWQVSCAVPDGAVRCAISQTQVSGENRQRVLAIEVIATDGGRTATGTLVLPFGLKLDDGISLAVDDAAPFQSLRFSTCLPAGCLVPLSFAQDAVAALQRGTAMKVKAATNEGGQEVNFSISLTGFTSALTRAAELTRS